MGACEWCGASFERAATGRRRQFCGFECRKAHFYAGTVAGRYEGAIRALLAAAMPTFEGSGWSEVPDERLEALRELLPGAIRSPAG